MSLTKACNHVVCVTTNCPILCICVGCASFLSAGLVGNRLHSKYLCKTEPLPRAVLASRVKQTRHPPPRQVRVYLLERAAFGGGSPWLQIFQRQILLCKPAAVQGSMASRSGGQSRKVGVQPTLKPLSKHDLAIGTPGGSALSPSMGRAAVQASAAAKADFGQATDDCRACLARSSLVRNGCCPGGPVAWWASMIWCPAVTVRD